VDAHRTAAFPHVLQWQRREEGRGHVTTGRGRGQRRREGRKSGHGVARSIKLRLKAHLGQQHMARPKPHP